MNVRVCDMNSMNFREDFIGSLSSTGFAVLTNHGIDHKTIKSVQADWRNFFTNNKEYKERFINKTDGNMGYKGFKTEKAVGAGAADLKEFYHWRPGKMIPMELLAGNLTLYHELESVAHDILYVIDEHEDTTFYRKSCSESDNTIFRALYYPAMDFSKETDAVRAAAHEDINMITLLVSSTSSGLQVKDLEGNWLDVPYEENSIIVNVGDMMQLVSKGKYKSTTHRVVNPDNSVNDRISIPMFIHPRSDTVLAPDVTAQQFLNERLNQIYTRA
jgi:isopenicillin N synthase-like dioxygenase